MDLSNINIGICSVMIVFLLSAADHVLLQPPQQVFLRETKPQLHHYPMGSKYLIRYGDWRHCYVGTYLILRFGTTGSL